MREMYDAVVGKLVRERPEWFAPPGEEEGIEGVPHAGKWIYSYENFKWAFALVISRHHYLPVEDFDEEGATGGTEKRQGRGHLDKESGYRLGRAPSPKRPIIQRPTVRNPQSPTRQIMQETLSTVSAYLHYRRNKR